MLRRGAIHGVWSERHRNGFGCADHGIGDFHLRKRNLDRAVGRYLLDCVAAAAAAARGLWSFDAFMDCQRSDLSGNHVACVVWGIADDHGFDGANDGERDVLLQLRQLERPE